MISQVHLSAKSSSARVWQPAPQGKDSHPRSNHDDYSTAWTVNKLERAYFIPYGSTLTLMQSSCAKCIIKKECHLGDDYLGAQIHHTAVCSHTPPPPRPCPDSRIKCPAGENWANNGPAASSHNIFVIQARSNALSWSVNNSIVHRVGGAGGHCPGCRADQGPAYRPLGRTLQVVINSISKSSWKRSF